MAELHGASTGSSSTFASDRSGFCQSVWENPATTTVVSRTGSSFDRLFVANLKLCGETNEILLALAAP